MIFDRHESPGNAYQRIVLRNAKLLPELTGAMTAAITRFLQRLKIKAEFDHLDPLRRGNSIHLGQFALQSSAECNNPRGEPRTEPFQPQENSRFGWAEITIKYVPMKCMH